MYIGILSFLDERFNNVLLVRVLIGNSYCKNIV